MARFGFALFLVFYFASLASAQNPPASDPQALNLVAQSIVAMSGGNPISDVTLTGNATWVAGSDLETGQLALKAKGVSESRIDLSLSGGTRTEVRNDTAGFPQGESIRPEGAVRSWAIHNCWINAGWFFPALSFLSATSDPNLIFSYVGLESRGGVALQHLRVFRYLAGQSAKQIALTQQLSTMDIYLDSVSLLPRAFLFTTHPDEDALTDIAIAIGFSNYQTVNGIQVPLHIQRLVQNGLAVDLVLNGITFNSGLADSIFAVQ
jgi:hypothetical protein